ncbi:MAG: ATP-binding protein [bacterium]
MSAAQLIPPLDPDDTSRLARRLRLAVTLCILPIILFALLDLQLVPRPQLWLFASMKLAALAVVGLSLVALRGASSRAHVVVVGLSCIAAMYAISVYSATLAQDAQTTLILTLAVALAAATLLPWGRSPQIGVVAIALVATGTATYLVDGGFASLLRYPILGLLIGLLASVHVAGEFEASRRALQRHEAEREGAELAVRQLNEQLERRVAQRTAELERVNAALQAEVTERARTEHALRQSQAAVTGLIENASDAIWSVDRDYNLTVYNAVVRQRFTASYGQELQPEVEHYPQTARADWERVWVPLYQRGLAGEHFTVEQTFAFADGPRHFVTSFNPIISGGVVTGLAAFSSDVTERKRAEEVARQRQAELTHVLRLSTMGEMAAGLAHEINQPLAAIVNYAHGTARRLRDDPRVVAAVLPVIDSIATEALRAGEIIRRLRHMVRKEACRQDWMDVNALIAEAARLVEPEARQRSVDIDLYLSTSLPPVLGDGIQIEQVVLNLLRNAIEAMTDVTGRRYLQVATRPVPDEGVEVAVRDTGPGMAPEVALHVFDPFFSTKPSGLGMGLSISRTIVESHNGRLWATPNPDGGTTFRVVLPTGATPAAVAQAAM